VVPSSLELTEEMERLDLALKEDVATYRLEFKEGV
jgi:hypothetical protein